MLILWSACTENVQMCSESGSGSGPSSLSWLTEKRNQYINISHCKHSWFLIQPVDQGVLGAKCDFICTDRDGTLVHQQTYGHIYRSIDNPGNVDETAY